MRLVDFLILLLEAHSESLKRLAALLGEDTLLELLENSENLNEGKVSDWLQNAKDSGRLLPFTPIGAASTSGSRSPYIELEGSVREFQLPAVLEFHLWAYPHYRAFIESDLDLSSLVSEPTNESAAVLVDEAIRQALQWIRRLSLPPALSKQAEAAASLPWIRFRTSVLRKVGLKPVGPVA